MTASGRPGDGLGQLLETAVATADHRAGMARVHDTQAMVLDVEHDQQEGDIQVQHAAVVELMVELADDPCRVGIALEEEPDLGRELGGQQGGGHPLADHIPHGDRPAGRTRAGFAGTARPSGKKP